MITEIPTVNLLQKKDKQNGHNHEHLHRGTESGGQDGSQGTGGT